VQYLGKIIKLLAGAIVILTLAGFLLPAEIKSTHSVTLQSKAEDVFLHINDLKEWISWMPFNWPDPIDETPAWEYSEPSSGKGAFFSWKHDHALVGNGTIRILESIPNSRIEYVIQKDDFNAIFGEVDIMEDRSGTHITWTATSSIKNPWGRYMSFFIKGWMLREVKESIRNLNRYLLRLGKVEGVITEVYFLPDNGDTVSVLFEMDTLFLDERLPDLGQYINNVKLFEFGYERMKYKLEKIYHPFYSKVGKSDDGRQILQIGYPVKDITGYSGRYQVTQFHGAFISTNYIGTEEDQYKAIEALEAYARINGLALRGAPLYTLTDRPIEEGPYKGIIPLVVSIQVVP
jgi:hypothetical protein